ncbi:MAG: hypothetical protein RR263_05460 [Oscillospiraceae bacterium]
MKILQFGTVAFPYNPYLLKIKMSHNQAIYTLPYKGQFSEPICKALTEVEGESEFLPDVTGELERFLTDCVNKQTQAMLYLPDCSPFWARLVSLELIGNGGRDNYNFKFKFMEVNSSNIYTQSINTAPFAVV